MDDTTSSHILAVHGIRREDATAHATALAGPATALERAIAQAFGAAMSSPTPSTSARNILQQEQERLEDAAALHKSVLAAHGIRTADMHRGREAAPPSDYVFKPSSALELAISEAFGAALSAVNIHLDVGSTHGSNANEPQWRRRRQLAQPAERSRPTRPPHHNDRRPNRLLAALDASEAAAAEAANAGRSTPVDADAALFAPHDLLEAPRGEAGTPHALAEHGLLMEVTSSCCVTTEDLAALIARLDAHAADGRVLPLASLIEAIAGGRSPLEAAVLRAFATAMRHASAAPAELLAQPPAVTLDGVPIAVAPPATHSHAASHFSSRSSSFNAGHSSSRAASRPASRGSSGSPTRRPPGGSHSSSRGSSRSASPLTASRLLSRVASSAVGGRRRRTSAAADVPAPRCARADASPIELRPARRGSGSGLPPTPSMQLEEPPPPSGLRRIRAASLPPNYTTSSLVAPLPLIATSTLADLSAGGPHPAPDAPCIAASRSRLHSTLARLDRDGATGAIRLPELLGAVGRDSTANAAEAAVLRIFLGDAPWIVECEEGATSETMNGFEA